MLSLSRAALAAAPLSLFAAASPPLGAQGSGLVNPQLPPPAWSPDQRLTRNDATTQTSVNFARNAAADAAGRVHLVWFDERDGNPEIYAKRSGDGGVSWGPPVRLTEDPGASTYPSAAADAAGSDVLHVVWFDDRSGSPQVYHKRSLDGGLSWSPDLGLTSSPASAAWPSVAVWGSDVHVVYVDGRDGQSEVYYVRSTDGGASFEPEVRLSDLPDNSWTPTVAVWQDHVYAAWTDTRHGSPQGQEEEYFKRSTDGGASWGPDVRLTFDPENSWAPSLAASGPHVWLTWFDLRDGNWEIYFKRSRDFGLTWSPDQRLTTDPAVSARPSIARRGPELTVVWWDTRDGNEEIYSKTSPDLGRTWGPDVRLTEAPGASTFATVAAAESGVHVAWQDDRDGNLELYYQRVPGTPVPVGKGLVAYTRVLGGVPQIFTAQPDGSGEQQLTTAGNNLYPAWSWDGARIVFSSNRTGPHELWTMNPDGSDQEQLTFSTPAGPMVPGAHFVPDWSPDGTRIAFASVQGGAGHPEIYAMHADGSGMTRLTFTPPGPGGAMGAVHPSWSADGELIAFGSGASGSAQVWRMASDGTGQQQLTNGLGPGFPEANVPEFSRDGSRLVFWSGIEGMFGEVWTMDPDGSNPLQLTQTQDPLNSDNPSWSPDGVHVLFDSNQSAVGIDVFLIDAGGGPPAPFLPGASGQTAWQPAFRSLAHGG